MTCAAARSLAGPGESESPPVRSEPETEDDQCWQTPGLGRTHEQSLSLSAESSQDEEQNTNKEQVGSKFCKL